MARSIGLERTLVERAQRGDLVAYESLATLTARRLYGVAQRITRDPHLAEDAVQQALLAMWRELPRLRDLDRFDAWAYRLAVRFAVAEAKARRAPSVDVDTLADRTAAGDAIGDVARRDELHRAFSALSPDQRAVVVLHHYVGLSLGEIAEVLGVPYGTVGSRLHHAIRSMRASVEAGARTVAPGRQPA